MESPETKSTRVEQSLPVSWSLGPMNCGDWEHHGFNEQGS